MTFRNIAPLDFWDYNSKSSTQNYVHFIRKHLPNSVNVVPSSSTQVRQDWPDVEAWECIMYMLFPKSLW